ncbi:MAG: tRNA (adenosine(37)-N6)-threonylcarbamoyltransferase complex transferase subunit TsaD [Acidimicrobiales bacterium]
MAHDAGARMRVLAIETSCDETAAAVVDDGRHIVSSVVSSQIDLHARYGGVVPELASRAHVELIVPIVAEALAGAGLDRRGRPLAPAAASVPAPAGAPAAPTPAAPAPVGAGSVPAPAGPQAPAAAPIGAVAATVGPGLVGSLLVGVSLAKALAMAWGVPFVGVNHLEGHLYASMLEEPELELPVVVLLVSGGHTLLVEMDAPGSYQVLGRTKDDAAGEAYDKVARYLGLAYPGGPAIDDVARHGDPGAVVFPRAWLEGTADFSFSGLKTAVVNYVRAHPEVTTADVAASFQEAVVDVLVQKTFRAAEAAGAKGVCLAGGVAANSVLRARATAAGEAAGLPVYLPSRAMCTDNAAMIGAAGYFRLQRHGASSWGTGAEPGMGFGG